MKLENAIVDDVLIVRCIGARLDAVVAVQFKEQFRDILSGHSGRVILGMGQVDFMDSSGLGAVVAVYKLLGGNQVFDLADLSPTVDRVFRLTRMDSVFRIFPTIDAALAGDVNGRPVAKSA